MKDDLTVREFIDLGREKGHDSFGVVPQYKIYTIGYGGRRRQWILEQLQKYSIKTLIDIRLHPQSAITAYNKDSLKTFFKENNINYTHRPEGGNPFRRNTGYEDIRKALELFREKIIKDDTPSFFIDLLRTFYKEKSWPVAMLCACSQAHRCHRGILTEEISKENKKLEICHLPQDDQISLF